MKTKTKAIIASVVVGAAVVGGGLALENAITNQPTKPVAQSVVLRGKEISATQYATIREDLATKVDEMKTQPLTLEDAAVWSAVLDTEIKKCNGAEMSNVTNENLIDYLNNIVLNGCK